MENVTILPIPCLSDNYAYLIHDGATGTTAVVDPSEASPVGNALAKHGWRLALILNTHHHHDHVGGNHALKEETGAKIVGPANDAKRIPGLDIAVYEGTPFTLGSLEVHGLHVPGHTRGAITYFIPAARSAFTGDTLFLLGCGRLFEGTPEQMFASLNKLKRLPPDTRIYCGHEYTLENERFAASVTPDNAQLPARRARDERLRNEGKPTVPALLSEELETNPFLRARSVEEFASLRSRKDDF